VSADVLSCHPANVLGGGCDGALMDSPATGRGTAWLWLGYLVAGVSLAILYYWSPPDTANFLIWPIIGWSSVLAILVGVKAHHPAVPLAWYLLAGGVAAQIVGDVLYSVSSLVNSSDALFVSSIDFLYLTMYPLVVAALILLVRSRTEGRDHAAIISIGVGLLSWVLLIAPYVRLDDLSVFERFIAIAYPVGDVALLATAVRLAVGGGRRPAAFWFLAVSLLPLLISDTLYSYFNLTGVWQENSISEIGWIAFYVGWGAAGLHPSMRSLSEATVSTRLINTGRLVVIGSAVLAPPVMLLIQGLRGEVTDAIAIAVASAVLFVLVLVRIAGLARDAADQKSEARFRALVDNASDAIVVLDGKGQVQYRTPSTERVLGRVGAELDGRMLADLLEEADKQRLFVMLSNHSATATLEWRIRRGDGDWCDLEVVAADMRATADIDGLVLTMRDITERKHLDLELRRQALHDSLTGLPNRTLFLDRVDQAFKRAERDDESVAVLLLDIDDFKVVNASLGHLAGDDLLIAVGTRLTNAVRSGVTVARLGGDEFAVLVEHEDLDATLELSAMRIQTALLAPFLLRDEEVLVRVSIGVAVGSTRTHTPVDVLRDADLAMYVAKRNGKDRFEQFLPAMHEEARLRLEIAAELRGAIENNELVVFYQPIVDVASGRTRGAEALVRWQHPHRGFLAPNAFIPIAEATGLIVPLGRWVLDEACRRTAEWKRAGLATESFYVSVNLSARHVQDENVLGDVSTALEDSGLAAKALVIEVTESALIEDLVPAAATLARLKKLGLRIAVDDFGTGYSSLAYLSNFPLDIIKLDKSFIDRVATTADGETMVRAVVALAHTLGLTAIAEGVEHGDQAVALEHLGCRLAQGYLFARPMPANDMAALLEQQSLSLAE
jgi:diguanylate cyclase (GGDEF)-like protein/PAS domain S-box-containing protein